jgi:hypothetical protein
MTKYTGLRRIDQLLDRAKETVNDRGNRVRHLVLPGERYVFDWNLDRGAWEQLDTENDASFFGIWINKAELRILSFVEGDVYLTLCTDADSYDAEVAELCSSLRPAPGFVAITDSARTDYYQDRRQFFVDPARAPEITEPGSDAL